LVNANPNLREQLETLLNSEIVYDSKLTKQANILRRPNTQADAPSSASKVAELYKGAVLKLEVYKTLPGRVQPGVKKELKQMKLSDSVG